MGGAAPSPSGPVARQSSAQINALRSDTLDALDFVDPDVAQAVPPLSIGSPGGSLDNKAFVRWMYVPIAEELADARVDMISAQASEPEWLPSYFVRPRGLAARGCDALELDWIQNL